MTQKREDAHGGTGGARSGCVCPRALLRGGLLQHAHHPAVQRRPLRRPRGFFDWSRDESTGFETALLLALLALARRRLDLIRPTAFTAASLACTVAGDALCALGVAWRMAWPIVVGVPLSAVADVWGLVLWLLACSELGARRACLCLAASGIGAVPLAFALNMAAPYGVSAALGTAASLAVPLLSLPLTRPFFDRLATAGVPTEQEVAHPQAFLPFGHAFYVYIFAFSVAYGFGLRCAPMSSAATSGITFAAMAGAALYAWRAKGQPRVDALFMASFGAVAVGFMLLLGNDVRTEGVAAALLVAGYMCCELLVWFALCRAAARNAVDAVPVICWGTAVGYLGICAGVGLWLVPNVLLAPALGGDGLLQGLVVTALLAALVLYVTLTRRTFSFDDTIEGIAPDAPALRPAVRYVDRLDDRCAGAAERFGLTSREAQVMRLLAHGNNASRVQEELGIGRNTVKYHAKNVYAKLGVHSQQELIDLVAGEGTA